MRSFLFIVILTILLLVTSKSSGQDVRRPNDANLVESPEELVKEIVRLQSKPKNNTLAELVPLAYPDGSLVTEYDGIESVIVKKLRSQYDHYLELTLMTFYNSSNLRPSNLDWVYDKNINAERDLDHGAWWLRSWQESLVKSRGGSDSLFVQHIGETIRLIEIEGVSLNNEGRLTTGDIGLIFDAVRSTDQDQTILTESNNSSLRRTRLLSGFQINRLLHGRNYDISFRPSVAIRGSTDPMKIVSSIGVLTKIHIFLNHHRSISTITIICNYAPSTNTVSAYCSTEVFLW